MPQDPNLAYSRYSTTTSRVNLTAKRGEQVEHIENVSVAIIEWEFLEKDFEKKEKEVLNEIVRHKATICQP